jgi:glycosyltransferase involved in cell wall biosynthesis
MQVVQVCIGKFHHFHLARSLDARGALAAIYSGYPWQKLKDEGLARHKVRTYPWLQAPYMALGRYRRLALRGRLKWAWEWRAAESLDKYASRTLPACDVAVGLSGSALRAGRVAQSRGAKYVCDRGSSHIRYQDRLLREEYSRWGVDWSGVDPRVIAKEEAEYEQADLITVPSEFTYQSFLEMGAPRNKLAKIPYGANISRFSPQGAPPKDKFIVLFVGQVSLRKGAPYLLQAFARFRHPNKELWIVGAVPPAMDAVLKRLPQEGVVYHGIVPNRELPRMYSQAHAFVLPSIEEGLAMVQGEAMACGCPVIATEHAGAADLYTDGVEGFIVPIRDPAAICERLTQLADEPERRAAMSAAGLARVRGIDGWSAYGEAYAAILERLVAAAEPARCHDRA